MRRLVAGLATLAIAALGFLFAGRSSTGAVPGAQGGQAPTAADQFEPVIGLPATGVTVLGSASEPGETWAYGQLGAVPTTVDGVAYANQAALLERNESTGEGTGWQVVPLPGGAGSVDGLGTLAGRVTPAGGVVLMTAGGAVVRDPGAELRLVPMPAAPGSEAEVEGETEAEGEAEAKGEAEAEAKGEAETSATLLGKGESLPPAAAPVGSGTAYAADEAGGLTGLLIAPYGDGVAAEEAGSGITGPGVLHYDGEAWTREPIDWHGEPKQTLTPQALACGPAQDGEQASSPANCWLLASYHAGAGAGEPNRLALFRRLPVGSGKGAYEWRQVNVADWLLGEATPPEGGSASSVAVLGARAQTLTVTAQGVWVDFQAKIGGASAATQMSELVLDPTGEGAEATVAGRFCFAASAPGCEQSIEVALPTQYESVAAAGGSQSELGTRVISGFEGGAMLELYGGSFQYEDGPGGEGAVGAYGAALSLDGQGAIEDGWIGEAGGPGYDQQGSSPLVHLTPRPQEDQLVEQPVPFRHPLLAVAQAPGTTPGDPNAAAIAVGVDGEIGRYTPGQGWSSESLYNSAGEAATPTLRGIAWPEANFAYAVGDQGTMWVWRAETGLWEPDPGAPYSFVGNLTAIAFDPGKPQIGYAVGKQGVLLSYGKTWEGMPAAERARLEGELKLGEEQLNFTAIAFAGSQALATYRVVVENQTHEETEAGGLLINEENGSGWRVDGSAAALLAQLPEVSDTVLSKVAGLPDGGAVAAGPGLVIERESTAAEWRFSPQPLPEAQNISALSAYREAGGPVRAIVSIDLDPHMNPNDEDLVVNAYRGDLPPPTGAGQPPAHLTPDPLPATGYLLKQTATGWEDMEHMALEQTTGEAPRDTPVRPDPALALLVLPEGADGLAVGGQTGDYAGGGPEPTSETAAAMRFGAGASTAGGDAPAPVVAAVGKASFAVGGDAACENPCASFADQGLAPDVLLTHALQTAAQISAATPGGLRGFLYTGERRETPTAIGSQATTREFELYSQLLGSAGDSPPVSTTASPNDVAASGGLAPFTTALAPFLHGVQAGSESAYYAFTSTSSSGDPVRVIVLDFSSGTLGATQEQWLEKQLAEAREELHAPAIVMGNAALGTEIPDKSTYAAEPIQAKDAASVAQILVKEGASAYLFDYPDVNLKTQIVADGRQIPAFGTGTLGYTAPASVHQTDSLDSSGFLLLEVETARRNSENVAPVSAQIVPNISQLALQASDGTLLRRSRVALFEGLARIPPSGKAIEGEPNGEVTVLGPVPYEPIPFDCLGANCADQIPADYTFTSSKPDIGGFVVHEAASREATQVQLGANHKPIPDEPRDTTGELTSNGRFVERTNAKGEIEDLNERGEVVPATQSGLFCAYNEGPTTITISAGGLSYSMPVRVQGGSSEAPCGTVPLKNPPPRYEEATEPISVPATTPASPAPVNPHLQSLVPPPAPKLPIHHHAHKPVHKPAPLALPSPQLFPNVVLVPPPVTSLAQPTPPSGTAQVPAQSPVSQQVGAAEREEEEQGATEHVQNMAAYDHRDGGLTPLWPLALIVIAAAAGAGLRPRRDRRKSVYAWTDARKDGG